MPPIVDSVDFFAEKFDFVKNLTLLRRMDLVYTLFSLPEVFCGCFKAMTLKKGRQLFGDKKVHPRRYRVPHYVLATRECNPGTRKPG